MARRQTVVLVCFALACLSPFASGTLAGPSAVAAATARVPKPAPAAVAPAPLPPAAVAKVRARLDDHATGLAAHELDALAGTIVREARRQDVPVDLVLAVMHVESRFDAFAVSPVGALGLMQLLPSTAEELADGMGIPWRGPRMLFDPQTNVRLGVAYLKWLSSRYDRLDLALAAYNWGPGRIDRRLQNGRPVPVSYARHVLSLYGVRGRS